MQSTGQRIVDLTGQLWELVKGDFGGGSDPDRVRDVKQLVDELRGLLPNTALSLRLSSLVREVETACSPAKWRKGGLEHSQRIAREDAYVIKTHAGE